MGPTDNLFSPSFEASDDAASDDCVHIFVDEAGDPTLFNAAGESLVGTEGCSSFFMMGKLEVEHLDDLATKLEALRAGILADPLFHGVESCRPERKKNRADVSCQRRYPGDTAQGY